MLRILDFFVDEIDHKSEDDEDNELHSDEAALIVLELTHVLLIMPNISRQMQALASIYRPNLTFSSNLIATSSPKTYLGSNPELEITLKFSK